MILNKENVRTRKTDAEIHVLNAKISEMKPIRAHNYLKLHLLKGHKIYLTVCKTRVYRQLSRLSRSPCLDTAGRIEHGLEKQSFDNIGNSAETFSFSNAKFLKDFAMKYQRFEKIARIRSHHLHHR